MASHAEIGRLEDLSRRGWPALEERVARAEEFDARRGRSAVFKLQPAA